VDRKRLHDSALFWVALGAAVALIGGILLNTGVSRTTVRESLLSSGWFVAGLVVIGVAALMLLWSLVLFVAHRYAQRLGVCPDPDAHRPTHATPPAPWPPHPIVLVEKDTEGRLRTVDAGPAVPAESAEQLDAGADAPQESAPMSEEPPEAQAGQP